MEDEKTPPTDWLLHRLKASLSNDENRPNDRVTERATGWHITQETLLQQCFRSKMPLRLELPQL
jgi:hypothetical protein